MLTRLRVADFQVIDGADLELGKLTVLTGPGRSGKSALLRAIRSLLVNSGVDGFIRHGTKGTTVELEFEDDTKVLWRKPKGKGGQYVVTVDGEVTNFEKTGGAVPPEVAALTKVYPLDIDKNTQLHPQVQNQMGDDTFIIGETGSKQARILGTLTNLDTVIRAQMECGRRLKEHERAAKTYQTQAEELAEELAKLPPVKDLQKQLQAMRMDIGVIDDTVESITAAERCMGVLDAAKAAPDPSELEQAVAAAREPVALWEKAEAAAYRYNLHDAELNVDQPLEELEAAISEADNLQDHARRASNACLFYEHKLSARNTSEERARDAERDAAYAKEVYDNACAAAGVCPKCGGLLDHTECHNE